MRSIAHRIYKVTIIISIISVVTMLVGILMVNEDLEDTLLGVEMIEERDFFIAQHHDLTVAYQQIGLRQHLVWQPGSVQRPAQNEALLLPAVFDSLPKPFSGEIKRDGQTYLVSITVLPEGTLYIARDISHFEARERLFLVALWVVAGVIMLLAFVLATLSARSVIRPLRRLADQIQHVPVGTNMPGLDTEWRDSELATIAGAFNTFVAELEAYVRREKSLLNLASHELRTPIAVISGALDVLEQRGHLSPADQATLARVRRATHEMQSNVNVLLALARKPGHSAQGHQSFSLATELGRVLEDLEASFPVKSRVVFDITDPGMVISDVVMARMLLRNLLQNALQHTALRVFVTLRPGQIEVRDEGPGLPAEGRQVLQGTLQMTDSQGPVSGLGLYLVTLMAERLGWKVTLGDVPASGTVIRVGFSG